MDSCSYTFGNLIRYFAFRRYLIDLKSFRHLLGFEMVEKQSKSIIESQKYTEIPDKTAKPNDFCPIGIWCATAYLYALILCAQAKMPGGCGERQNQKLLR